MIQPQNCWSVKEIKVNDELTSSTLVLFFKETQNQSRETQKSNIN